MVAQLSSTILKHLSRNNKLRLYFLCRYKIIHKITSLHSNHQKLANLENLSNHQKLAPTNFNDSSITVSFSRCYICIAKYVGLFLINLYPQKNLINFKKLLVFCRNFRSICVEGNITHIAYIWLRCWENFISFFTSLQILNRMPQIVLPGQILWPCYRSVAASDQGWNDRRQKLLCCQQRNFLVLPLTCRSILYTESLLISRHTSCQTSFVCKS